MTHASVVSSKHKVELNSNADRSVVGDECLVIHDHNGPVNVYSYDPKDRHRSAKTVDVILGYQDPQIRWVYILMMNKNIYFAP